MMLFTPKISQMARWKMARQAIHLRVKLGMILFLAEWAEITYWEETAMTFCMVATTRIRSMAMTVMTH